MQRNANYDPSTIQTLRVRLAWANLDILSDDVDEIQLLVAGDQDSVQELHIELENGVLTVEQPQFGISFNLNSTGLWMQVCLRLPRDFAGEINAGTISGAVGARTLTANELSLETVSGALHVQRLRARQEINLRTVSGSISANTLAAPKAYARTISGSFTGQALSIPALRISTVSGKAHAQFDTAFQTLEIQSVSGALEIVQPCDALRATFRALSSKIRAQNITLTEDPAAPCVIATSVSGSLTLSKNP